MLLLVLLFCVCAHTGLRGASNLRHGAAPGLRCLFQVEKKHRKMAAPQLRGTVLEKKLLECLGVEVVDALAYRVEDGVAILSLGGDDPDRTTPWGTLVAEHRLEPHLVLSLFGALDAIEQDESAQVWMYVLLCARNVTRVRLDAHMHVSVYKPCCGHIHTHTPHMYTNVRRRSC